MQSLNSKNYEFVDVVIRDFDDPYRLNASKGNALIKFLTDSSERKHVKLNGIDGSFVVVRTTDILKILPVENGEGVKKYV